MRIGIYGGSFNPVHNVHINIVKYLLENNYLDKVIIVPTGLKYEYKNDLISANDRYNMLKLAFKNMNNVVISKHELKDKLVYTYQTLDYFKSKYKQDDIYFICGSDNLDYIDKWKNGEYILNNYKIILISREMFKTEELLTKYKNSNITLANIEEVNISSTMIRNNIKENKDVAEYINGDVLDYIKENNLYR